MKTLLEDAKTKLVDIGFKTGNINIVMATDPYPTIAEGIIEHVKNQSFDMVVIGRKRMSKAEEFVMGDPSIKLIRALEHTAVLVVKS